MASSVFNTLVSDVITPERFAAYVQLHTEVKSRLVKSGAMRRNPLIDQMLAGGGITFNLPSWKDLPDDAANVSSDATADKFGHTLNGTSIDLAGVLSALSDSKPKATGALKEIGVRLSRNQSWGSADLTEALAGEDPMASIGALVTDYWDRRDQDAVIAMVKGICKDNGVNDSGDYCNSIVGAGYTAGVTDFSAEAWSDTLLTLGDSMDDIALMVMHSVVYNKARKNNLIDFVPDSEGLKPIKMFGDAMVIVDDNMPSGTGTVLKTGLAGAAGMYETWGFGPGALQYGLGSARVPVEIDRQPQAGNGGGQEILYSRRELCFHMRGHAYVGTSPNGGPSDAASTNNLNIATSWDRRFTERKQIKFCRLLSREA